MSDRVSRMDWNMGFIIDVEIWERRNTKKMIRNDKR